MKQLGPNIWYGDYELLNGYRHLKSIYEKQRLEEDLELSKLDPSARYFHLARKEWERPFKYRPGGQNLFRMHEHGLMELASVQQKSFPDLIDCNKYLIQIANLYVCDLHQGQGIGRKILDDVVDVAERSCCAVILFVCPYAFDAGGEYPRGITTFDELADVAFHKETPILYYKKTALGSVRKFYENAGFVNMCLNGPDSRPSVDENDSWQYEYVYIPSGFSYDNRKQLEERLKSNLSEFCKCQ